MSDPIDLNSRREARVPEPDGEPLIVMPMDSDQIIFRDQDALDEYVAGATDAARAEVRALREFIQSCIDGTQNGSDLAYMQIPAARAVLDPTPPVADSEGGE